MPRTRSPAKQQGSQAQPTLLFLIMFCLVMYYIGAPLFRFLGHLAKVFAPF